MRGLARRRTMLVGIAGALTPWSSSQRASRSMSVSPVAMAERASLRAMFLLAAGIALAGAVVFLFRVEETHRDCQPMAGRGPRWRPRPA